MNDHPDRELKVVHEWTAAQKPNDLATKEPLCVGIKSSTGAPDASSLTFDLVGPNEYLNLSENDDHGGVI